MRLRITFLSMTSAAFVRADDRASYHEYDPAKWPKVNLELATAATLKDVFDSGLRPYRFPGLENTTLEVKHLSAIVILGSGKTLPRISFEVLRIKPFPDGHISTLEGYTPRLSLQEAEAEMARWLDHGEAPRTRNQLAAYLDAVRADPIDFDDPYRGIPHGFSRSWKEPGSKERDGGPRVAVWFKKTVNAANPLRLHFKASWSSNRPTRERVTYHPHPIPPPSGYEHVNMTAPKNFGPDSAADILRARNRDAVEAGLNPERAALAESGTASRQVPESDARKGPGRAVWISIVAVVAGLIASLLTVWKSRHRDL